ncbi:hypothetical protein EDB86DRAFT_2833644 [Lactarius hatsudake]|nr:hypothetical protein EDB86DRAFT_2833644 [Lactarius hatsudake]
MLESPYYSHIIVVDVHHGGQYPHQAHASAAAHYQYPFSDPDSFDSVGYFPSDGPLQGQHQHSLVPVPSGYSHYDDYISHWHYEDYAQPPILPILPSSSYSELSHALVETPPPESQPIRVNHGFIALPSLPMPSSSSPKDGQSKTLVGLNSVEAEYASCERRSRLAIPGQLAYSPGARNPTPLSSSFSSSDIGTPTSSIHLDTNAASSSQVPAPASALEPMTGVLKLPSTKWSARHKAQMACLFCHERKIACKAPSVGSACNQCVLRSRKCEYPTVSRRGLHRRRDNGGSHHKESEDADNVRP